MLDETRQRFRNIYASKPETVEWMIASGSQLEKAIGSIIKQTALGK